MPAILVTLAQWILKNPVWVLVIGLAVAAGVQTVRLNAAEAAEAEAKLEFSDFKKDLAEQSLKAANEAAERNAQAVDRLKATVDSLTGLGDVVKTEIRNVRSNGGPCLQDPAYLSGIDGVQRLYDRRRTTGSYPEAPSGRPSTPTVPRAPAPGTR